MRLDESTISTLAAWADPIGVLSLYLSRPSGTGPLEVKRLLMGLEKELESELGRRELAKVHARLEQLEPEVEKLVDPRSTGRGRALFAPISDSRVETVSLQLDLPTRVELQKTAVLEPLVAALDEGRPAGMVTIHRDGVHYFEWRLEETEEMGSRVFDADMEDEWRHMHGPARANPTRGQQTVTHREQFEHRVEGNRYRFLEGIAAEISALITTRKWERLVLFGDARLVNSVRDLLPEQPECDIFLDHRLLDGSSKESLRQHVAPILHEAQRKRELDLVARVRDVSASRGRACVGLLPVLDALNQSRVTHLLVDGNALIAGRRTAGGLLFAAGDRRAADTGEEVFEEANLVEHMVKRALATDAKVTPIEGSAAEELAADGGVAALLRW